MKNPNILVHPFAGTIYHMYYGKTNNPVFCMYAKQLLFKPKSIVYNEEKKEITTTYKAYNILLGRGSHTFGALNFGLMLMMSGLIISVWLKAKAWLPAGGGTGKRWRVQWGRSGR